MAKLILPANVAASKVQSGRSRRCPHVCTSLDESGRRWRLQAHRSQRQGTWRLHASSQASGPDAGAPSGHQPSTSGREAPIDQQWKAVVFACSGAAAMAAVQRTALPVLSSSLVPEFGLDLLQLGALQSAVLAGYVAGQLPAGFLADKYGGLRVLTTGLTLWSAATVATSAVGWTKDPLAALAAGRAAMGLAQSTLMPAVSAAVARRVPEGRRAVATSTVYSTFSAGSVLGLAATPVLAAAVGWKGCLLTYGVVGLAWAAGTWVLLRPGSDAASAGGQAAPETQPTITSSISSKRGGKSGKLRWPRGDAAWQLVALCWVHGVIGWGFFMLQTWVPVYLQGSLAGGGPDQQRAVGLLSALPWLGPALSSVFAGSVADSMLRRGWRRPAVRRAIHTVATLGAAVALLPLALCPGRLRVSAVVGCLTAALALQGLNYAGYHSYVQDVAPERAGLVLGLTNTFSTLAGIAANLATGVLAQGAGGFGAAFGVTSVLYCTSWALWVMCMRGQPLAL